MTPDNSPVGGIFPISPPVLADEKLFDNVRGAETLPEGAWKAYQIVTQRSDKYTLSLGSSLIPHLVECRLDMDAPIQVCSRGRQDNAALHSFIAFIAIGLVGALANVHRRAGGRSAGNSKSANAHHHI